jgi:aspartate ammonia-lyase
MKKRTETDLLGKIEVPAEALYGAQTQRAINNFPLGKQRSIGSFPSLVQSLLLIKKAAADTNTELGFLNESKAGAIRFAADQLLSDPPIDQFPIHILHGGGGTSANMNVNEVLANLGEELLGGHRGEYRLLHPNEHVNLNQSTNDVYPTACHMAIVSTWPGLKSALTNLSHALKTINDPEILHLARTCFQDAVEIHFYDYLGGIAAQIDRLNRHLNEYVDHLHVVNLGGTICGRSEDVPATYLDKIVHNLSLVTHDPAYIQADNLFDAAQNPDDLVAVSDGLDCLARSLIKIAKDLRILNSGPEAGLGEIRLPAVQPGSSIMPGKINPVIPEFLIQIGFRVIGNHAMSAAGLDQGELDLNVWESSMVFPILESIELLQSGVETFTERCIQGMHLILDTNRLHTDTLIPHLTHLARKYGYQRITEICKSSNGDTLILKQQLDKEFGTPLY